MGIIMTGAKKCTSHIPLTQFRYGVSDETTTISETKRRMEIILQNVIKFNQGDFIYVNENLVARNKYIYRRRGYSDN